MLTDKEKKWLKKRKPGDYCRWRDCSALWNNACISISCYCNHPAIIQDGYIFEARVAAKLAKEEMNKFLECITAHGDCPYWPKSDCAFCRLKAARLQVEEEMKNVR